MSRVAVATCSTPGVDEDQPLLLAELARAGVDAVALAWDDPGADWSGFDLVVVRSTWDYADRRGEFLAWAKGLARVANPYPVLEYSSDKHYLGDLAARGVSVVETVFCDVGSEPAWPDGDVVVKPAVGAGSIDAARYSSGERGLAADHVARLHAAGRDALIQPYVGSVDSTGELALVYVDGRFSHAMTKAAMLNTPEGDRTRPFRAEAMSPGSAEARALAVAAAALAPFADLAYARVDLVITPDGWRVLELELVEPSLFLLHRPAAARGLATAIARRARRRVG